MNTLQILLVLLAVALLLGWWWLRRRGGNGEDANQPADRIDTITGWPPQPTRVLSTPERLAYGALCGRCPNT